MIDCKVYSISQWDWYGGGLHNRFVWDFDRKSFYTDDSGTHEYTDLLASYKVRLKPKLIFIME